MKARKHAKVNKQRCVACGACSKVCPKDAVHVWKGCFAQVNTEQCVGCGKCVKSCPADCIEMEE